MSERVPPDPNYPLFPLPIALWRIPRLLLTVAVSIFIYHSPSAKPLIVPAISLFLIAAIPFCVWRAKLLGLLTLLLFGIGIGWVVSKPRIFAFVTVMPAAIQTESSVQAAWRLMENHLDQIDLRKVLPDTDPERARVLLERLHASMSHEVRVEYNTRYVYVYCAAWTWGHSDHPRLVKLLDCVTNEFQYHNEVRPDIYRRKARIRSEYMKSATSAPR